MNFIIINVDPGLGSGSAPYVSTTVHHHADDADTLGCLQSIVGGNVGVLDIGQDIDGIEEGTVSIWFNDEGKIEGLPFNPLADRLVRKVGLMPGDHLVGNTVITGFDFETGKTIGLTDTQRALLVQRLVDETVDLVRFRQAVFEPAVEQPPATPMDEPTYEWARDGRSVSLVWDVGTAGLRSGYGDHEPLGTEQATLTVMHNGREDRFPYTYTGILSHRVMAADRRSWSAMISVARHDPRGPVMVFKDDQPHAKRFSSKNLELAIDAALATLRELHAGDAALAESDPMLADNGVLPFFQAPRVPADQILQEA